MFALSVFRLVPSFLPIYVLLHIDCFDAKQLTRCVCCNRLGSVHVYYEWVAWRSIVACMFVCLYICLTIPQTCVAHSNFQLCTSPSEQHTANRILFWHCKCAFNEIASLSRTLFHSLPLSVVISLFRSSLLLLLLIHLSTKFVRFTIISTGQQHAMKYAKKSQNILSARTGPDQTEMIREQKKYLTLICSTYRQRCTEIYSSLKDS